MRRRIVVAAILAALCALSIPVAHADTQSDEAEFVSRINALRASVHVPALRVDAEMTGIARRWAQQMATNGDISHQPDLREWVTSVWHKLGENVGVGYAVASLHDAFVTSPHHYDNMVDPAFDSIGVGVVLAGGHMWVAEEFKQGPAAKPATTTPPTTARPRPAPTTSPPTTLRPPVTTTTVAPRPPPPPLPPPPPPEPQRLRLALELQRVLDATMRTGS